MDSERIDWKALERLRGIFLRDSGEKGAYWQSRHELQQYHNTFGQRISWKWESAIENANQVGWAPSAKQILDWGCGSGVASLAMLEEYGTRHFERVLLWDHSILATTFAKEQILEKYPCLSVETFDVNRDSATLGDTLFIASHVLNELSYEGRQSLGSLAGKSKQIFWVEPGEYAASRFLVDLRETLLDEFGIVAPCVHCESCPLKLEENGRHWCHFFGHSPIEAFTEGDWSRFATMMEIDLRSLPYSFLVADRGETTGGLNDDSRIIGRPRQFKGYARMLSCGLNGLVDYELQKRDDKSLWKSLKKGKDGSLYNWTSIEEDRIKSGKPSRPNRADSD